MEIKVMFKENQTLKVINFISFIDLGIWISNNDYKNIKIIDVIISEE